MGITFNGVAPMTNLREKILRAMIDQITVHGGGEVMSDAEWEASLREPDTKQAFSLVDAMLNALAENITDEMVDAASKAYWEPLSGTIEDGIRKALSAALSAAAREE